MKDWVVNNFTLSGRPATQARQPGWVVSNFNLNAGPATRVLQSEWGSLSEHLMATVYPVEFSGAPKAGAAHVRAPVSDGQLETSANWQSPFENTGAESKAPALLAMLQNGTLGTYADAFLGKDGERTLVGEQLARFTGVTSEVIKGGLKDAQGRSGMTKLNSTQVFNGAPPVKLQLTLQFRAYKNAGAEVTEPIDQLISWSLAEELSQVGSIASAAKAVKDGTGVLKALLPSKSPQMVGLKFGGYTFSPMVIESVSRPMTGPRGSDGASLNVAVQVGLATLTAMDREDWSRARKNQPIAVYTL